MKYSFLYTFLAFALLTTAACDALKPATSPDRDDRRTEDRRNGNDDEDLDPIQSRRVYDPETGTYVIVQNAPTGKMDTVVWTDTPEERMPPITDSGANPYVPPAGGTDGVTGPSVATQLGTGANGSRLLSSYNVDFALPFLTHMYLGSEDQVNENSKWALHFYSGAQMAMDELRSAAKEGNFYVGVTDTKADDKQVRELIGEPDFTAAQLIVGPYVKGSVAAMAEAVKDKETVVVSPFSAGTGVSSNNPNYIQVNPTLNTHLKNILDHASTQQGADRIVLVTSGNDAEKSRIAALQTYHKVLKNDAAAEDLEVLTVDINAAADATFDDYLTGRKTVFIVPVYEDESFVANFLRRLYSDTRDDFGRSVAVYGLPQWMDFTRINFDYYEGTNVHVSSSVFVDLLDPAVRSFRREFYDSYATLPREEAYVGYDVTRYFLRMLNEYGTRFQYSLPDNRETLLHTKFHFAPVVEASADGMAVEGGGIDRFENMFVNILQFRDFTFRRVN